MNEIERAINTLKDIKRFETPYGRLWKMCEVSITALEKQIPKQLTDAVKNTAGSSGGYLASCPNCRYHILVYRNECHCDKCGQKVRLDWSVEE